MSLVKSEAESHILHKSVIENLPILSAFRNRFKRKNSQHEEGFFFHQQIALKFVEETSEVLLLEHSLVMCGNLDTSQYRSEVPCRS